MADILRKDIHDPRLEMAVITGVEMSRDLKSARIYFSTSAGDKGRVKAAQAGFRSALGYIRRTLARELELRYMPTLRFFYDESFDYGARIDAVLKSVRHDDDPDMPDTGEDNGSLKSGYGENHTSSERR